MALVTDQQTEPRAQSLQFVPTPSRQRRQGRHHDLGSLLVLPAPKLAHVHAGEPRLETVHPLTEKVEGVDQNQTTAVDLRGQERPDRSLPGSTRSLDNAMASRQNRGHRGRLIVEGSHARSESPGHFPACHRRRLPVTRATREPCHPKALPGSKFPVGVHPRVRLLSFPMSTP